MTASAFLRHFSGVQSTIQSTTYMFLQEIFGKSKEKSKFLPKVCCINDLLHNLN